MGFFKVCSADSANKVCSHHTWKKIKSSANRSEQNSHCTRNFTEAWCDNADSQLVGEA